MCPAQLLQAATELRLEGRQLEADGLTGLSTTARQIQQLHSANRIGSSLGMPNTARMLQRLASIKQVDTSLSLLPLLCGWRLAHHGVAQILACFYDLRNMFFISYCLSQPHIDAVFSCVLLLFQSSLGSGLGFQADLNSFVVSEFV